MTRTGLGLTSTVSIRAEGAGAALDAETRELAALWDGVCPEWDEYGEDIAYHPYPGPVEAASAAGYLGDLDAALCMASYWRETSGHEPTRYFWVYLAVRLGADAEAELLALESELPRGVIAEQRGHADYVARRAAVERP